MAAFIPSRYHLAFVNDHVLLWGNLSRLNGLLIILNISMFFLTGLVAQGYYYTFYSLFSPCSNQRIPPGGNG